MFISLVQSLRPSASISKGGFPSKSKENASADLNEETVFDHLRKKSKNHPVLTGLKMLESKPLVGTKEHSFTEQPHHTTSEDILRDYTIISNAEPLQVGKDPCHAHSLGVSRTSIDISSMKMLLFDGPTAKKNASQANPHESPGVCKKLDRPCSGLAAGKTKETDSCLGFRSIFSFLWFLTWPECLPALLQLNHYACMDTSSALLDLHSTQESRPVLRVQLHEPFESDERSYTSMSTLEIWVEKFAKLRTVESRKALLHVKVLHLFDVLDTPSFVPQTDGFMCTFWPNSV